MSLPVGEAITVIHSYTTSIALLINGVARIVEGFSGKHSSISRAFLIGVGTTAVVISAPLSISPSFFGPILAGTIIGIGLVIRGIQTVFASQKKIYRNARDILECLPENPSTILATPLIRRAILVVYECITVIAIPTGKDIAIASNMRNKYSKSNSWPSVLSTSKNSDDDFFYSNEEQYTASTELPKCRCDLETLERI